MMDRDDCSVALSRLRIDTDSNLEFDDAGSREFRCGVGTTWPSFWKHEGLEHNRTDATWPWRSVFGKTLAFPGEVDARSSSRVGVVSDRHGTVLEGFVNVAFDWESVGLAPPFVPRRRRVSRPRLLYLDTIAVAPWNRLEMHPALPRIPGVGRELLKTAIRLSMEFGTGGGFAFHPAPAAQHWYTSIFPGALTFTDGREYGLIPTQDASEYPYMEVALEEAVRFLES